MIRFGSGARMGHGHGAYGGPEHGSGAARLMLNPLPHHNESNALISASPERVFALADDHERLSAHMSQSSDSLLRVFIDYALPSSWPARWLGRLFGGYYAHWCTQRMVNDAVGHLASDVNPSPAVRARGLEKS